jgi:DNA-binding CsgD family transcriptional regulator
MRGRKRRPLGGPKERYPGAVPRLEGSERAVFEAVRADCRRGLSSAALRGAVAERLSRHLRADAYCAMELDPFTGLPVHHVNRGWPADYVEPLVEHALWASPLGDTATLLKLRRRAVSTDELLGSGRIEQDPYYQFHILPYGYRYELQVHCQSAGTPRALLTFNRRQPRGEFEPRHVRLLEALSPHLGAAVHAASVRESQGAPTPSDAGFVLLDEQGGISHAAGAGARHLSELGASGSSLGLRVFVGMARRAMRAPARPMPAPLVVSESATGARYQLVCQPCVSAHGPPHLAILVQPARPSDPAGLARLGLTPREAEVTAMLLRGDRVADCAIALGCAPATVAEHKKHVFAKLGVSSRRELAVRLLAHGWKA